MSGTASRLQVYSAHYMSEFWIFTFSLDNGYLLGIMEGKEEDCQVWSCDSTHIIRVNNGVLGNPSHGLATLASASVIAASAKA